MKLDRLKFIAAVDDVIAASRERYYTEKAEHDAEVEQAQADWLATYTEAWRDALTRARKKLTAGQPLRKDDFPRENGYYATAFYDGPKTRPADAKPWTPPEHLVVLKAFLEAISDDEVSTTVLREAGFRNLERYVRKAV